MKNSGRVLGALIAIVSSTAASAQEANQPQPPPPPILSSLPSPPRGPLAGYGDGTFFIRDPHEWFVLYPKGRLHIDGLFFLNRGDLAKGAEPNSSQDTRPHDTIIVRRARVELQGTIARHFDFQIAGEFATVPGVGQTGSVTDAYVIVDYLSFLKLQVGQFDVPFTIENRTTDKYTDFMERSLAVRDFAVPANKDVGAMIFGWTPKRIGYYSLGVFNGDGMNFRNQDNSPAVIGRAFVAPLAWMKEAARYKILEQIWVGASFWWQHNTNLGGQAAASVTGGSADDLSGMTTQGGWSFFSSSFANGNNGAGNAIRSHLTPQGEMLKWAVEANVPVWRKLGLRFELVHQSTGLAQYDDTNPVGAKLVRSGPLLGGTLSGTAFYVEAFAWILGDIGFLEMPGVEPVPRLRELVAPHARWGLMLAAKYERLSFDVGGLPLSATPMGASANPAQGNYLVQAFELGMNAWLSKHLRISANYVLNRFESSAGEAQANLYRGRDEHELLFRIGANL